VTAIEFPSDGFAELTLGTDDLAGLERFQGVRRPRRPARPLRVLRGARRPRPLRDTLEARGAPVGGSEEHDGGDRSIYVEDPAGNIVEVWDFFARRPIEALTEDERFRASRTG
jgi:hypothetical protein